MNPNMDKYPARKKKKKKKTKLFLFFINKYIDAIATTYYAHDVCLFVIGLFVGVQEI